MHLKVWGQLLAACLSVAQASEFTPLNSHHIARPGLQCHCYDNLASNHGQPSSASSPLAGAMPFRVMFIGASITRGYMSTGNLGFRKFIRDKFVSSGNAVNLVGSQRIGDFKDNELEAYSGNRIDQIHKHATRIVPETLPNLFVVHVGSNDCLQDWDIDNFGMRMKDFVDYLLVASLNATVVMSTLLVNNAPDTESCVLDANSQIRDVASILENQGKPVVLAEMHCCQRLHGRPQPVDLSPDGTHPVDKGYQKMAEIFWTTIVDADNKGFFRRPEDNGIPADGDAEKDKKKSNMNVHSTRYSRNMFGLDC
ncbi:SGNH hydrolase-type esterase domain-containing protein [Daldinia eschscholtzii]|nr:SGNH hydrolase-type esterase domain-containing protein [Daldinia eschscholtzii]